jgi:large subunit ribosomal protein L22
MAGQVQIRAVSKYIKGSPVKARRVVNLVRGMSASRALETLELIPQTAAVTVAKTIKSAVANADDRYGLSADEVFISQITANEGPRWRRVRFAARGRIKPIRKRTSHITVILEDK